MVTDGFNALDVSVWFVTELMLPAFRTFFELLRAGRSLWRSNACLCCWQIWLGGSACLHVLLERLLLTSLSNAWHVKSSLQVTAGRQDVL